MKNKDLFHVGVLGMKWGKRKSEGLQKSSDHLRAEKLKKKKLSELSNEEIQILIARTTAETQYKAVSKNRLAKGRSALQEILVSSGKQAIGAALTGVLTSLVKGEFEKLLKSKG